MKEKMTLKQVMREVHNAYDFFEKVSRDVLREEFGFGDKRIARYEEKFSELAANECIRIESDMRRRLKRR